MFRYFAAFLLVLLAATPAFSADVEPLPLVPEIERSTRYRVFVDDVEVPVGVETTGGRTFDTAAFVHRGAIDVRVVVSPPFEKHTIRPLRFKLTEKATIEETSGSEKEIRFSVDRARKLLVELDDLPPLVLIGSPPEENQPDKNDPNVIYFGPGVHEPGRIRLKSNQTVYLDAGAKVYGTIEGFCVENVRVAGRGHLYGTKHTNWDDRTYGLVFDRCRNVTVEQIGLRDSYWWITEFLLCDGVEIRDINILSFNRNNGGLMIDSCSNLRATDSLLMSMDDCICPHALNAAGNGEIVSDGMLFENLVLYNVFTGNAIRIGASFETSEVRNWTFRNIDVVYRRDTGSAIYADHSDWAKVRNLVFENFTDEATAGRSIDMRIDKTRYSCQTGYRDERGSFDGLYFKNVHSHGGEFWLRGFDDEYAFDNVVFAGCSIAGKPVDDAADVTTNDFVRGVRFLPAGAELEIPPLAAISSASLETSSPDELVIDDGDEGFRSYGFTATSLPGAAHGDDAQVGRVANRFGQYAGAIYEPRIAGRYEILVHTPAVDDADERAPWIIRHADGYAHAFVNQRANPGWQSLGEFVLDATSDVRLVYPNYFEPTDRPVIADAVRFVKVD